MHTHFYVEALVITLFLSVYAAGRVENQEAVNLLDLQNQFIKLAKRVQELELRDIAQQVEISSLKAEVLVYKQRINTLEKRLEKFKTNEYNCGETKEEEQVKQAQNYVEQQVTNDRKNGHHVRQLVNKMNIAFFATLHKHALHTGVGQNIVFDRVVTNIGSAYSDSLGAFTAPISGIYVFSVSIMAYSSQTEHYVFSKNGQMISNMYVRSDVSPYGTAGVTAVLYLNKGDNVEVKTADSDGSAHGSDYSSFSGFLLQQDDNPDSIVDKLINL